ncbi:MAG: hypothetical protein QM725_15405 [Lacibacter sp.]
MIFSIMQFSIRLIVIIIEWFIAKRRELMNRKRFSEMSRTAKK